MGCGEFLNAAGGRMKAQLQFVEDERALYRDRQFAIENKTFRRNSLKGFDDIGKIAGEWLAGLRLQKDLFAVAKREATEAVPLRLVLPLVADGNFVHGSGFHRR